MGKKSARPIPSRQGSKNKRADPRVQFQAAIGKFQAGLLREAKSDFRKLKKRYPEVPDPGYFLSLIACQGAEYTEATRQIRSALAKDPKNARFVCQLANVLRLQGDLTAAVDQYHKALAHDGQMLEAWINLGVCLRRLADLDGARNAYIRSLEIRADIPEAHNNLGSICLLQDELDQAEQYFQRTIEIDPRFAGAWHNLGRLYMKTGELARALPALRQAVVLAPDNTLFLTDLSACLGQTRLAESDPVLEQDLLRCLKLDRVDGGTLGQAVGLYLVEHSPVGEVLRRLRIAGESDPLDDADLEALSNELLLVYMEREQVCNPDLEFVLTRLRQELLARVSRPACDVQVPARLLQALACQCFYNEYVFAERDSERHLLDQLDQELCRQLNATDFDVTALLVYACYRPLYRHPRVRQLRDTIVNIDAGIGNLVRIQITEPLQEEDLRKQIPSLSGGGDATSGRVRQQYEENPYPRWFQADHPPSGSLFDYLTGLFPRAMETVRRDVGAVDVLVAGCGTGLQTIRNARRLPAARITGLDLSLASLAYALRKSRAAGLDRIRYYRGDILDLEALPGEFDFIESFGVLHHMRDPLEGWRCLRKKLRPGGIMRIGLYSYLARGPVRAAREFIASRNYGSEADDIRRCRQEILALSPDHPAHVLRDSPDFYSLSECRDLMFHINEHQLDIPFIKNAVRALELRFLGFEFPDTRAMNEFSRHHPAPGSALDLDLWHDFERENPATFVSQYVAWLTTA